MNLIDEEESIVFVQQQAEKKITLPSGHQAVVVESGRPDGPYGVTKFEGTVIYVPGVHLKELGF